MTTTTAGCGQGRRPGTPQPTDPLELTVNQTNPTDFDGCNRRCRLKGAHTLVWGDCEHATAPEPTVSLSRVFTATDGLPAIGFDSYTVPQLGELITAGLRASDLPVNGDDLVDIGIAAAHAIVHRNDEQPATASAVLPEPTSRAVVCICGHTEQQHFEDACITEITGCECGDFLPVEAAAEEIARLREIVRQKPPSRAAVLLEAAAAIEAEQAREEATEWAQHGELDHETEIGGGYVRASAALLRRLAAEAPQPCPTPCDPDCDAACHEVHQPPRKRDHQPNDHAAGARQQPETEARPVSLATPCILCQHPFNWHDRKGCQFGNEVNRCGCRAFSPGEKPAPVDPRTILGIAAPEPAAADSEETRS